MRKMGIMVVLLLAIACARAAENPPLPFFKGFSWGWVGSRGDYLGEAPAHSMKELADTGTEYVAIAFAAHMPDKHASVISYGAGNTLMVQDAEILRACDLARKNNLKILLKPVVNVRDDTWRAEIKPHDWGAWWNSYEAFVLHYAALAALAKAEGFVVGCEMRSTEKDEQRWRGLIAKVRTVFAGWVFYNSNHDDFERLTWWDVVDAIGISGYFAVATPVDTSLEKMLAGWKQVEKRLAEQSQKWKLPVVFMEIGVRSAKTCSSMPWDWSRIDLPYDGEEQARFYESAFRTFWDKPYFRGYFWWDWKSRLYKREEANRNLDFSVYGKPAEDVLRKWYAKLRD